MGFKNILVPTDGSEYTKAAIVKAMELAKLSGGRITALYVLDQTILTNMPMDTAVMNVYNTLEKEGKEALDFVKDLGAQEGVETEVSIKEGTPVKVILEESSKYTSDSVSLSVPPTKPGTGPAILSVIYGLLSSS